MYPGDVGLNRTLAQHEVDCQETIDTKNVNRVKGSSILMLFNIISSFVPDYMHNLLLGIVNEDYNHDVWFDPSNNEEVWYIGTHIQNLT